MNCAVTFPALIETPRLWLAVPHDRCRPPIAVLSDACSDLHAHLEAAGIDPMACDIGRARLSSVDVVIDWDRVIHQSFD